MIGHDGECRQFFVRVSWGLMVTVLILLAVPPQAAPAAENAATIERRLARFTRMLSADELEGRGIGTNGLNLAAEAISDEFQQLGLKTALYDGSPFQKFTVTTAARIGKTNRLAVVGPESADSETGGRIELLLGEDFNPLAIGGSGKINMTLVFVGYGITAKKLGIERPS